MIFLFLLLPFSFTFASYFTYTSSSVHGKLWSHILSKNLYEASILVHRNKNIFEKFDPMLFNYSISMAKNESSKEDQYVPEYFPFKTNVVYFSNLKQIPAYLVDNFKDVNFVVLMVIRLFQLLLGNIIFLS